MEWIPPGTPPVVIVTAMDPEHLSPLYMRMVDENRRGYASKHGRWIKPATLGSSLVS